VESTRLIARKHASEPRLSHEVIHTDFLLVRAGGFQHDPVPGHRATLPAELTRRPFTRARALALGVTPEALRGPAVRRIDRGIFLDARLELTLKMRLAGYLLVLPRETVVDGVTALQLNGVDVGTAEPYRFCTTAAHHPIRPGLRVRRVAELPPNAGGVSKTLPALVAARTELSLLDLVVAGDWLIRLKRAPYEKVRAALHTAVGRDCLKARRAAELVRGRVDSPRETRLRLLIVLAGLPEPECNVELGDELFFIGRVDLYLRAWNVAVEYEGDQHRTNAKQYDRDLGRYEDLAAAGYLTVRVSKEAMRKPRNVADRIYRALVSRGYTGPPPHFGAEWRDAFEPQT
jgi:hypothetical protein